MLLLNKTVKNKTSIEDLHNQRDSSHPSFPKLLPGTQNNRIACSEKDRRFPFTSVQNKKSQKTAVFLLPSKMDRHFIWHTSSAHKCSDNLLSIEKMVVTVDILKCLNIEAYCIINRTCLDPTWVVVAQCLRL